MKTDAVLGVSLIGEDGQEHALEAEAVARRCSTGLLPIPSTGRNSFRLFHEPPAKLGVKMSLMIGRLQRVALREVWKHEAQDFTQWLQNNIDILNEALDLNLVGAERERAAGDFNVDLVAEDEGGGTVVIENQLEKSNHDHLGKLLTYLSAMGAKAGIWIVSDPVWTENSTLAFRAHFREEWRLRNPPIPAGLSLAELQREQWGPFVSDRSGKSGVSDSYPCEVISRHWLGNSYCSHHPR